MASDRALPRPTTALGMLCYKVFLVYISNVCDNLPAMEVARSGGPGLPRRSRAGAHLP